MKHDLKIGDQIYLPVDKAPFEVVGIRREEIELFGDWSGGTNPESACTSWVKIEEVKKFNPEKPQQLMDLNPDPLRRMCQQYLDFVDSADYCGDNSFKDYIFETAMETVFGHKIWEYINNRSSRP